MKYFEVNNDNNHLQIDDTYMNLYMTRKIKINDSSGRIQFQNNEMIAAIGNGTNSINGYCSNSNGYCDYYIENPSGVYIYIFSNTPESLSSSGVQIFNESGNLIFDSNHKQAKVIAVGTTSGTVIGNNIAIASGGLTINSDLAIETKHDIRSYSVTEEVTTYEFGPEDYEETEYKVVDGVFVAETVKKTRWVHHPVKKNEIVFKFDVDVYRKTTRNKYMNNVYINGGIVSTKQFKKETSEGNWELIYWNRNVKDDVIHGAEKMFPGGTFEGVDKSSGTILAYSFVVVDVNGL